MAVPKKRTSKTAAAEGGVRTTGPRPWPHIPVPNAEIPSNPIGSAWGCGHYRDRAVIEVEID